MRSVRPSARCRHSPPRSSGPASCGAGRAGWQRSSSPRPTRSPRPRARPAGGRGCSSSRRDRIRKDDARERSRRAATGAGPPGRRHPGAGLLEDGRRTGFDIVNLATGESARLARESTGGAAPHAQWSRFSFSDVGLALGRRALGADSLGADVVLVDEVGPFELAGGGWAPALDDLARDGTRPLIMVVRSSIVDAVRRRWGSADSMAWDAAATPADEIVEIIIQSRS